MSRKTKSTADLKFDLLYVRHPNEKIHDNQVKLLDAMSDPDKSEHAELFRLGNAATHYYHKTEPTEEDYEDWLLGLPDNLKNHMRAKGYEGCKSILTLQQHALERRDVGMNLFIRKLLNDHHFEIWQNSSK